MSWRFVEPNKPIRASEDFLEEVDEDFIVDAKLDGWRLQITNFGKINVVSRRNIPRELPDGLMTQLKSMPVGMELDAEWINPTRMKAINSEFGCKLPMVNNIVVFDIRWRDNKYIPKVPLQERRQIDYYQSLPKATIEQLLNSDMGVYSAISVDGSEVDQFYQNQKQSMLSEGIVIKRKTGQLGGQWYKVKYRK